MSSGMTERWPQLSVRGWNFTEDQEVPGKTFNGFHWWINGSSVQVIDPLDWNCTLCCTVTVMGNNFSFFTETMLNWTNLHSIYSASTFCRLSLNLELQSWSNVALHWSIWIIIYLCYTVFFSVSILIIDEQGCIFLFKINVLFCCRCNKTLGKRMALKCPTQQHNIWLFLFVFFSSLYFYGFHNFKWLFWQIQCLL